VRNKVKQKREEKLHGGTAFPLGIFNICLIFYANLH